MDAFKIAVVATCRQLLESKVQNLSEELEGLMEAATHDSKSTAGDKHETARAMVQLEQERTGQQLKEAQQQLDEFGRIDFQRVLHAVGVGSLVHSGTSCFLVALGLGKVAVNGKTVFVISAQSPLGKALHGAALQARVMFNGTTYEIQGIS